MRKIKFAIILLFSFILVGCGSKNSITGDTFASKMTEMNYSIKDVLSNYDYAASAYNAYKDEVSVFFLKGKKKYDVEGIFIDEYQNLFNEVGEKYDKKLSSGKTWKSLMLKTEEKVYYISWISDSYIIIKAPKNKTIEVEKVIKTLGY